MQLPAPPGDIYEALTACQTGGVPAALAIIVASSGSTPQKIGAKMLVRADGTVMGTVGGGQLEAQVIQAAQEAIQSGAPRLLHLELSQSFGHLCGGHLQVYLEPIAPRPPLIIIGAGHVGLALAALASFIDFRVTLADDREIDSPPFDRTHAELVKITNYHNPFETVSVTGHSFVVIATRGHQHDLEALTATLKTPAGYIGLLGSVHKRAALSRALQELGFPPEALTRVHTPVGLALSAVTPAEIAVSIAAQLIAYRRNHVPKDFGPPAGRRLLNPDGSA